MSPIKNRKKMTEKNDRLYSLDALRGFDMFFISGGDTIFIALAAILHFPPFTWWGNQMDHVEWDGFHAYDLIFPLFLFLAGLSFVFSLKKRRETNQTETEIYKHIFKRAFLLVILGIISNGFLAKLNFIDFRYASVLGRIGLAWMFGALIVLKSNWRWQIVWIIIILMGYWAVLASFIAPDADTLIIPDKLREYMSPEILNAVGSYSLKGNIAGYIDRLFLPGKFWLQIFDPEGYMGIIPATATALLGALTGRFLIAELPKLSKLKKGLIMAIAGAVLLSIGWIWDSGFPVNKNLWSSSFVCVAAGWSLILLSVFYIVIDVFGYKKWSFVFKVIGVNSIAAYMIPKFFSIKYTNKAFLGGIANFLSGNLSELILGIGYAVVLWLILYVMYRQKWFLKV